MGSEGSHLSRGAEHLVDFARVQLLGVNHLPSIFLEHHRAPFHPAEKFAISRQCLGFGLQRFTHDRADIVLMAVEQRADLQRRIGAQQSDHFTRLLAMGQGLGRLLPQPRNNRDPVVAEDKTRKE